VTDMLLIGSWISSTLFYTKCALSGEFEQFAYNHAAARMETTLAICYVGLRRLPTAPIK